MRPALGLARRMAGAARRRCSRLRLDRRISASSSATSVHAEASDTASGSEQIASHVARRSTASGSDQEDPRVASRWSRARRTKALQEARARAQGGEYARVRALRRADGAAALEAEPPLDRRTARDDARAFRVPARRPPCRALTAPPPSAVQPPSEPPLGAGARESASAEEVQAYRSAYAAWRCGDYDACIDRFRQFLQTYPASPYADDAAYWMAECHFKKGDYKSAVLRFDDVVARYPEGNKSADALYRQGEALLKLGPGYAKAASKAFERVVAEYPDSPRAAEAKKQARAARQSRYGDRVARDPERPRADE